MALSIKRNVISITRGDTGYISVSIPNYIFQKDDKIILSVKRNVEEKEYIFQEEINFEEESEVAIIKIKPEDTKDKEFGEYIYDIEFINGISGDVNTIITPNTFIIDEEVT